jgi:hypothetical protein
MKEGEKLDHSSSRPSRDKKKTPPTQRTPRSFSTPSRKQTNIVKNLTQDIRVALEKTPKRKTPDSSPGEKIGGHDKVMKGNHDVH